MSTPFTYTSLLPPSLSLAEVAEHERANAHVTERHLQCIWSDAKLRPGELFDDRGEVIEVVDPGRWNLEAGPDFLDATLLIGTERRRVSGDVEIHIHPRDWQLHGHHSDHNYSRVVAHVTYLPGVRGSDTLPPSVIRIALRDGLQQNLAFTFDDIDLSAYPHAVIPATPRSCAMTLGDDPALQQALLRAAGMHRMERKVQRMGALIARLQDPKQAFYETFMAALGYKLNTSTTRRLAQLLPLAEWSPAMEAETHYARLLSAAALLPAVDVAEDEASHTLLRRLWHAAWQHPVPAPARPLTWCLGALRPSNHPTRRLAIAAALFSMPRIEVLWEEIPFAPPAEWFKRVIANLIAQAHLPCWERRLTLQRSTPERRHTALLGKSTAAMLTTNVVVPWLIHTNPAAGILLEHLPGETLSAPMRSTAYNLLGRDHNPALYAGSGLLQQGLLQIHNDFCLNALNGCHNCRLAAALADNGTKHFN